MKSRLFATLLTLAMLLSLVACAEKTPTKYPKNDFANLLTTDFWSMTESDLDAFLTAHRWKSVPDAEGQYLVSFMKEAAILYADYSSDGLVTALTVEQQPQTETTEDVAAEFARFFLSARQVLTDYRAELDGETGMRLHGDTEETLTAFFRNSLALHAGIFEYVRAWFNYTAPAQEGPYLLSNGAAAELATQITYRLEEPTDPIKQVSTQALRLYAPDYLNPQPSEPESDVWGMNSEYPVADAALPEWLSEADGIETLLGYSSGHTLRSILPQEYVDALLQALPQWVGEPMDADSADAYDGAPAYELYFYNGGTFLGHLTLKPYERWMVVFIPSDEGGSDEEARAYYRFHSPDLNPIFELGTPRHQLPIPASMQITSPEGQTVQVPPAEAAALAMQFNDALFHASDAYWPNVKDKWKDGDHWILRVTGKDGAEKQITLDCYTSVSIYYSFSQVKDELGLAAFSMPKEQMDALKELLQGYME